MFEPEIASPILFHGPAAQTRAAVAAGEWGVVLATLGDPRRGLDRATVLEAVEVLTTPPIGDRRGSVVVGPLDVTTQEGVEDGLLKSLEDVGTHTPRAHLWAYDEGGVRPTIRSRCVSVWCPGHWILDGSAMKAAREVVRAAVDGSIPGVLEALAPMSDSETWRETGPDFLRALAVEIAPMAAEGRGLAVWERARKLLAQRRPSYLEVVAGLLP